MGSKNIAMQNCKQCSQQFEVTDEDLKFYDKVSPKFNKKKYPIPPPEKCPECRQQQRLAFRNERKLYIRKCDLCKEDIISMYSQDKPYTVYCTKCWWSDEWDPKSYSIDFDYSRSFFEQFGELMKEVPHLSLTSDILAIENNCSYINFAGHSKNCYMIFDSDFDEDSYYSNVLKHSKNCMDCSYTQKSELCYECIDCTNCYNLHYSQDCTTCTDSYFLKNCKNCSDCILSANLHGKKYYILNEPHTKEEYFKALKEFNFGKNSSIQSLKEKFKNHILKYPQKFRHSQNTENCSGDYIFNAKNCHGCYNVAEGEDLKYCDSLYRAKDCMDVSSFGEGIEKIYESGTIGFNVFEVLFSQVVVPSSNSLIYCYSARMGKDCFGTSDTKSGQYLILNKQYSKKDYEQEVAKIIDHMISTGEWGKHFPHSLTMFGYNETVAQEYFPLNKEEALKLGFKWKEEDPAEVSSGPKVEIPDGIKEVTDEILKQILTCEKCGEKYKIIKQELEFYKKQGVPIPGKCPDCRHESRMAKRNPRKLWDRKCDKCSTDIQTTYAPDSTATAAAATKVGSLTGSRYGGKTVYCEKCYLESVY